MQYNVIVNPDNLEFFTYYQTGTGSVPPLLMVEQLISEFVTIQTSENPEIASASKNPNTGEITIVRDQVKLDVKVEQLMIPIRAKRLVLLLESDYTQFPDVLEKLSDTEKTAWKVYRQALRDFPNLVLAELNATWDLNMPLSWPTPPW